MTQFNDFLKQNKIVLIGYPQLVDSSKVAFLISEKSKSIFKKINIITTDLINSIDNIKVYNYSTAQSLLAMRNELIIIDDLESAKTLNSNSNIKFSFITELLENNNNVIVLITFGLTRQDLDLFKSVFRSASYFWTNFLEKPFTIKRIVHKSKMTPRQENIYAIIREEEIKDNENDMNFKYSQRICNLALPDDIFHLIDTDDEPSIIEMMQSFETLSGSKFDFEKFLNDAPKIIDLIDKIKSFPNEKQVIYTRYNKHYGVEMLKILFEYYGYKVYSSTSTMTKKQHLQEIEKFNEDDDPCLYITSFTFTHNYNLHNITQLHLLNSDSHVLHSLLDLMFKYRLYSEKKYNITIHSYICESSNINNADSITFKNFFESQKTLITLWNSVSSKGTPLLLNGEDGLLYF